ncbi:hypothetical protein F5887DRAFT_178642 [Amanita rubescens]|nr:hypothetical protein F5887DRAFT_178642 [Amanita rubescens]
MSVSIEKSHFVEVHGDYIHTIITGSIGETDRDPIPPKPSLFLGRDKLLHDVVKHLSNNCHVALLGPGGIGKSSIGKVVLYDSTIIQKFGDQRFFVRFDDVDSSLVTFHMFCERIAKALGVKASENPDNSFRKYLSDASGDIFLVLDNAETFLQAGDPRISTAIGTAIRELADMTCVTILLTTRNAEIPPNPRLKTMKVPPLDEEAAYATFAMTYGTDVCPSVAKNLICTLEFHPLSITLLAQVARQSEWTPEKLVEVWKEHQTRLLDSGNGKSDSLETTIELSLKSPSILTLGDNARHFLRAIASLPQGVDEKKLKHLFPTVGEVDLLAAKLRKHSLLYLDGEKNMMLAPIRLYLTDKGGPDSPLLVGVRAYYYDQLEKFADPKQGEEGSAWITTEDINVERLIALDLPGNTRTGCEACVRFTELLIRHKSRPTALYPAVKGLPQHEPKLFERIRLRFQPAFRRVHPLVSKGTCFQSLALLAHKLGRTAEALDFCKEAEKLFILARDRDMLTGCERNMGDIYVYLGDFAKAGRLFKKAQSKCKHPETRAALNLSLGNVAMFTKNSEGRKLLKEAEHYYKGVDDKDAMNNAIGVRGYIEMYSGDYQAARRCFKQIDRNTYTLVALSEVSWREGDSLKALELLDNGVKEAKHDEEFGFAMAIRAAVASNQDDFIRAREQINEAAKKVTLSDNSKNMNLAYCVYISARNELFANELLESRDRFSKANDMFKELGDIRFRARCERALGEIAFLENDSQEADDRFEKVQSLCEDMGISAELLYICFSSFFLKDSFEGWKTYQEKHTLPRTLLGKPRSVFPPALVTFCCTCFIFLSLVVYFCHYIPTFNHPILTYLS